MAWLTAVRGLAEPPLPVAQVTALFRTWRWPPESRRWSLARFRVPRWHCDAPRPGGGRIRLSV